MQNAVKVFSHELIPRKGKPPTLNLRQLGYMSIDIAINFAPLLDEIDTGVVKYEAKLIENFDEDQRYKIKSPHKD